MNEHKFTGKAAVYDRARPSYPLAAIEYMLALTAHGVAADIGSGTGKLTELLLQRGCRVFAVEPNDEMRSVAQQRLKPFGDRFISMNATAEKTKIAAASVDFITVAQALHWFDTEKFRVECKRILRPNGKVFVVYNKLKGRLADGYEEFLTRHCRRFTGFGGGDSDAKIKQFFAPDYTQRAFASEIKYDARTFTERALSSSYTPKESDGDYGKFIEALARFFDTHQKSGHIAFENVTTVYHD